MSRWILKRSCYKETSLIKWTRRYEDGSSEALRQKCRAIIEKYDEYGLWEKGLASEFCSHQTFLETYKGSW